MGCPACAAGGIVGGWVGGYFGINPPETRTGRVLSGLLTSTLTLVTLLAIKVFFNKTLCGGPSQPVMKRFCRLVVAGLFLGIIYSLAVNYLIRKMIQAEFSSKRGSCGKGKDCGCNAVVSNNESS